MAKTSEQSGLKELGNTVVKTVEDAQSLLQQHGELFQSEATQELQKAGNSLISLGLGTGLTAVGGAMGGLMLVHLVHRLTRLPLWACYGLAASGLTASGVAVVRQGQRELTRGPRFPESIKALKENWKWLMSRPKT